MRRNTLAACTFMAKVCLLRKARVSAGLMLLVLLLASCASTAPQIDQDADNDPNRLAERGLHEEAALAWASLAWERPDEAAQARRSAARQWLLAGRPDEAQRMLDQLERSNPGSAEWYEVELLAAEIALASNEFDRAEQILSTVRGALPEALRERYDLLRQRLDQASPDSAAVRVEGLRQSLIDGDFKPETALALLLDLPLETLRDQRRQSADQDLLLPWLDLAATARAHLLDDPALSRALGEWRQRFSLERPLVSDLLDWIWSWRELQPMPSRVTILLPGQGPLVAAGDALRDGMLAFWFELPRQLRPELDFQCAGCRNPDVAAQSSCR
ncbi:MAG: penicillin-binding protein activator [Xanthomonadaceae bacterium]|nr:penicillin-binding protein activator [Xanthomonadaceae bacterium]